MDFDSCENKKVCGIVYPSPIFGPVHSRRLGISLGINLMPSDGKLCTFDCIYCECGFNADHRPHTLRPSRFEVAKALDQQLQKMKEEDTSPDVLTFAGNGEPTAHPEFPRIIEDTLALRNNYFPNARVSVLSNATFSMKPSVRDALMLIDNNIQKLDTISPNYIKRINRPVGNYEVAQIINSLKAFHGHVIVQTLFMKGTSEGQSVDNTSDEYVLPWIEALKTIQPSSVMIYTIDRETPEPNLIKASPRELDRIALLVKKEGIEVEVAY